MKRPFSVEIWFTPVFEGAEYDGDNEISSALCVQPLWPRTPLHEFSRNGRMWTCWSEIFGTDSMYNSKGSWLKFNLRAQELEHPSKYQVEEYDEVRGFSVAAPAMRQKTQQQHKTSRHHRRQEPSSGEYGHLWECFAVSYGQVRAVSVEFGEVVENFEEEVQNWEVLPAVLETLDLDIGEDVVMWQKQLRYSYCGEEEDFMVCEELISNFERHELETAASVAAAAGSRHLTVQRPPNFPVPPIVLTTDDVEPVEIRKERPLPCRPQRSKTFNFDLPKTPPKKDFLEAKGVSHIVIGDELCTKIKRNQKLFIQDDQIQRITGSRTETLKSNVRLKNGAKLLNKKEVEMRDVDDVCYLFHFDTAREAKNFVDTERSSRSYYAFGEKQITIKSRLLRLLGKRSSRDQLESKGILKNEPIFGNTLDAVYKASGGIPPFISRVVDLIELPRNIRSMGVYRASGNLAVIQKIRCEVDLGRLDILDEYGEDVDVLTGTLKLFFRELREPLISAEICQRLLNIIDSPKAREQTTKVIETLPEANREILLYLLQHLVKVCSCKDENKMDIYNMSVCWGPSLIAIPEVCMDLVLQTSNVSKVMEYLLRFYQTNCCCESSSSPTPSVGSSSVTSERIAIDMDSSKESLNSNQSFDSKGDGVYQVIKKLTELIERNVTSTLVYRQSGNKVNVDDILKKIDQRKLTDLDQVKDDVHDLCSALKKYLSTLPEPIIPKRIIDQYCIDCDKLNSPVLNRKLRNSIDSLPCRDALLLLFSHLRKILENDRDNKMPISGLINCWTPVLMPVADQKSKEKITKFNRLLHMLLGPDPRILPDLVQQEQLRMSKYDNVPDIGDNVRGEANVLDEKTETRL